MLIVDDSTIVDLRVILGGLSLRSLRAEGLPLSFQTFYCIVIGCKTKQNGHQRKNIHPVACLGGFLGARGHSAPHTNKH